MPDDQTPSEVDRQSMTHSRPQSGPAPKTLPQAIYDFWNYQPPGYGNTLLETAHQAIQPDLSTVLNLPTGGGGGPVPATIIGPMGANLHELALLANANQMLKGGAHPELVLDQTGWFRHPSVDKMLMEVSDEAANWNRQTQLQAQQMRPGEHIAGAYNELFTHPELAQRYPQLGQMPVHYESPGTEYTYTHTPAGMYGPGAAGPLTYGDQTKTGIYVKRTNPELEASDPRVQAYRKYYNEPVHPDEDRKTLLHEGQHAVFGMEGVPNLGEGYRERAAEAMARSTERRRDLTKWERHKQSVLKSIDKEAPFETQTWDIPGHKTHIHDNPSWPGSWWSRAHPQLRDQFLRDYKVITGPDPAAAVEALDRYLQLLRAP